MSTNEFDRLMMKKVSEVSYDYDAAEWEKLEIQLAGARRRKRVIVLSLLASGVAACMAIFLGISLIHTGEITPAISSVATKNTHALPPPAPSAQNSVAPQYPASQSGAHIASIIPAYKEHHRSSHPLIASNTITVLTHNNPPASTPAEPFGQHPDIAMAAQNNEQDSNRKITSLYNTDIQNKPDLRGLSISVTGGLNYGTVNTGYAVGAIAEKQLSRKFGIEVRLAYVGNTAIVSNSSQSSSPPYPVFAPAKPSQAINSTLNYLQFASMTDFSLSKRFIVSAGADLQRLLQQHDIDVLYNDDKKVVPLLDLGMLLRTEYGISDRIKVGLSCRLGANNIVSSGNNYLERNYMQVEVRCKLH